MSLSSTLSSQSGTSSMRVAMLMCVATACYLSVAGLHLGTDLFQVSSLVVVLLGAGFTGKVMQKPLEGNSKIGPEEPK